MVVVNKVAEDAAIRERHSEVLHLHTQCVHLKMMLQSYKNSSGDVQNWPLIYQ